MKFLEPINFPHIRFITIRWYNNCGIVLVYDQIMNQLKCYISGEMGNDSECNDIIRITSHGSNFPLEAAKVIFTQWNFNIDVLDQFPEYFI